MWSWSLERVNRRRLLRAAPAALVGLAALAASPAAAAWPERPITIVVPFGAGGGADIMARVVAPPLSQALGVPVVVENRPGAAGNIGIRQVARAKPDGYTLIVISSVMVVNQSLYESAGYDALRDFTPVINVGTSPNALVVPAKSPIKDFHDFVARAKAPDSKINWAAGVVGATPYLAGEILKLRLGLTMEHIPYQGTGPALQATLGEEVDMLAVAIGAGLPSIKQGSLRALAQTGEQRWPDLPDVPTLAELGVQGAETDTHQAMYAPAGTPREIVDRVAEEVRKIVTRPEVQERFRGLGLGVLAEGPDEFRKRVVREVARYREVIQGAGLKLP